MAVDWVIAIGLGPACWGSLWPSVPCGPPAMGLGGSLFAEALWPQAQLSLGLVTFSLAGGLAVPCPSMGLHQPEGAASAYIKTMTVQLRFSLTFVLWRVVGCSNGLDA